jgi:hypothetical protein
VSSARLRALRWFGATALGRSAGRRFYRRQALGLARELIRVEGVEAVYLTGSARFDVLLGYSDVDLMLVTELPTLESELRLRRALVELVRRHNRPLELFSHVDYVEARDLGILRAFGNAYSLELDAWHHLAGAERGADHRVRAGARHRELAELALSLRRWVVQGAQLTAGAEHDPARHQRGARRLLLALAAAWADLPGLSLPALLETARGRAPGAAFLALARDPARPASPADLVEASLEVVDAHAAGVCGTYSTRWPAVRSTARLAWSGSAELAALAARHGFAGFEIGTRGPLPSQHLPLLVAPGGMGTAPALHAFRQLLARAPLLPAEHFGSIRRPALLTPSLRCAAALIEPFPLFGIALAAAPAWPDPAELEPPAAPPASDLEALATMALVQMFWRPRGRGLRFKRGEAGALQAAAVEVRRLAPLLIDLAEARGADTWERRPLEFWRGTPPLEADEAALVADLRALLELLRPRFRARLGGTGPVPR